jgi:tetratricopeptide (TPR) repeat protein
MFNKINISSSRQKLIIYVVLVFVTLAVFWQVNQFDFINMDDDVYLTGNLNIHSGFTLERFKWAFSTTYAEFWHPLTWLSLMLDYHLYAFNAGGYHLTNLILHILNTLLLFWLFDRMAGEIWRSAFVAAFFALHPLHVESVAWVAERKDVLSAFFYLLTLSLYVYYVEKPVIRRYLFVLLCFVFALMSKSIVVTLPLIMILLDYWPLSRFHLWIESRKNNLLLWQFKEKISFFIFSAALAVITLYAHQNASYKQFLGHIPLDYRIASAPVSLMTYLGKIFWPHDLAIFYPMPYPLSSWYVLGASLLIIIISIAVIVTFKSLPYLFVGWLWYIVTLLPVVGVIPFGPCSIADHYTYLPSIGIAIMIAWGIPSLIKREDVRKKILFPAGIIFLSIMAIFTWQQCSYWKNSIKLWSHALKVTKETSSAHNYLALALLEKGKIGEAIDHYTESIRIKSDYFETIFAYTGRGAAYATLNQYQRAIEDFNETIRLKPGYATGYYNLGIIYAGLGQYKKAIEEYNEAIRLKPDFTIAYGNRGVLYLNQGNKELGCYDVQKACALGYCGLLNMAKKKGDCR